MKKKTKKPLSSITLFQDDNPAWVLCPGHVGIRTFNKATGYEWSPGGGYKKENLKYEYWIPPKKKLGYYKRSTPENKKAKPFTVVSWD